jgi:hypothetical protein
MIQGLRCKFYFVIVDWSMHDMKGKKGGVGGDFAREIA